MEEPKDKRTKAYKDWKANQAKESKGLGDTIAKITKVTGIDKVVKFIAGEDCGCDERKEYLNKIFPYKNAECLTEDEYFYLDKWYKHNKQNINFTERTKLIALYNRVLNKKQKDTRCGSCIKDIINTLKSVYNAYLTNQ